MEPITSERNTNEEILLHLIQDFFDCRKLSEHLIFLDNWLEKALVNKKNLNAKDLIFFSTKFLNLLRACYEIGKMETSIYFEESLNIPENFIIKEQKQLAFYPTYLRIQEICNPLLAFQNIFKKNSLDFYISAIQGLLNESLTKDYSNQNTKHVFRTYIRLKRMVETCWLIHERSISKNSYQAIKVVHPNYSFALSCPLLLTDEYLCNPYLMVEEFFSFAGVDEYRNDLTKWFKAALNDQESYENANDLLFIHNQIIQLIHAGYLIGSMHLAYVPKTQYTTKHDTFGHWLLARMQANAIENNAINPNPIQILSPHFKENPIEYCIENLTIDQVIRLRYGLKEWLEAGLSENSSIANLDYIYNFAQFEEIQKILEAMFLLIVQPALKNQNNLTANIH